MFGNCYVLMPKGLKPTSSQITVSFESTAIAGAYTSKRIDLQLNALDNEVFVVTAVKIDMPAQETNLSGAAHNEKLGGQCALTKQESATSISNLGQNTCFATARNTVVMSEEAQAGGNYAIIYQDMENNNDTPSDLDYLDVIATPDFYVGLEAFADNTTAQQVFGKVYGYRARADAATYAALVQSELLSQ